MVPGGTYFFTVRLRDRGSELLVEKVDLLRQAVRLARKQHPFEINAAVILPARLHMIWTLPPGDADFVSRWRQIKTTFSRHVPATQDAGGRNKGVWERRYWEHLIRDQADFDLHEHLIIHAPVSAGLVTQPSDWALSSLHTQRAVEKYAAPAAKSAMAWPISAEATMF